jgi:hypothetical protein
MDQVPKSEFFDFFRQRLANLQQIENLSPATKMGQMGSFNPELNILLSAELDALAKYWAINKGLTYPNSPQRLGDFLASHAGPPWSKCSHLNLMKRASDESKAAGRGHHSRSTELPDPARQEKELFQILQKILGPAVWTPQVISWMHDADLDLLLQHPDISVAGIPGDWLRRSRYGEMLYRHYRSGWLHALNPDPELETEFHFILGPDHEPHYFLRNTTRAFAIPTEFILASFEPALRAFEAEIADGTPVMLGA